MTRRLDTRLTRLEAGALHDPLMAMAVVRAPLPDDATEAWARGVVNDLGWQGQKFCAWVVDGPALEVVLPVGPVPPENSPGNDAWLSAGESFPQCQILTDGQSVTAWRMATREDLRRWDQLFIESVLGGEHAA